MALNHLFLIVFAVLFMQLLQKAVLLVEVVFGFGFELGYPLS